MDNEQPKLENEQEAAGNDIVTAPPDLMRNPEARRRYIQGIADMENQALTQQQHNQQQHQHQHSCQHCHGEVENPHGLQPPGMIPTMSADAKGIQDVLLALLNNEPLCCQYFVRFSLLSLLLTAIDLSKWTEFNLKLIHTQNEVWRIFTYPLAESSVFSNWFSLLFCYLIIKDVENKLGTLYTTIVIILSYFLTPGFAMLISGGSRINFLNDENIPWDFLVMKGVWPLFFTLSTVSIVPFVNEINQLLCFPIFVSARMHSLLLGLLWQLIFRGDFGALIGLCLGFLISALQPRYTTLQSWEKRSCLRTQSFLTLDEYLFTCREQIQKHELRNSAPEGEQRRLMLAEEKSEDERLQTIP